jgi:hypothetical protein
MLNLCRQYSGNGSEVWILEVVLWRAVELDLMAQHIMLKAAEFEELLTVYTAKIFEQAIVSSWLFAITDNPSAYTLSTRIL